MPTGLDPWNQLLGRAPGHYTRLYEISVDREPPKPEVHWPDQQPLAIEGTWPEKLNAWLTLVQRGEVINAYRVFLGLWEEAAADPDRRTSLLAQLVFAGLIDVQDRVFHNRSYTTGHKSYRARATVALARMVGWENAHSVVYAGVPDIAVGPRWYSSYEMGCLVVQSALDNRDRELLDNDGALSPVESMALQDALLSGQEPGYIDLIVGLLKAGKGIRQIIDTIQLASAQLIMETGDPNSYSMPQHSYEYCNTVRWFFDTFQHPHRLKLLFVAASFVNRSAHNQRHFFGDHPVMVEPPKGSDALTAAQLLSRLDDALDGLRPFEAMDWTAAYLRSGFDRAPLVQTLAVGAAKAGNDPHNQELGTCLLDDYGHSTAADRDRLLLSAKPPRGTASTAATSTRGAATRTPSASPGPEAGAGRHTACPSGLPALTESTGEFRPETLVAIEAVKRAFAVARGGIAGRLSPSRARATGTGAALAVADQTPGAFDARRGHLVRLQWACGDRSAIPASLPAG
jgi:hypothetical protein